LIPPQLTNT
jgi:trafficking protein particle complex subunit 2